MTAKLYKVGDVVRLKDEDELYRDGWRFQHRRDMLCLGGMEIRHCDVGTVRTIAKIGNHAEAKIGDSAEYYTAYVRAIKMNDGSPNTVFIEDEIRITDEMIAEKKCQQELQLNISAGNNKMVEVIIQNRIEKTKATLIKKAKQYASNGRLGNFYDIADFNETTPEKAAMILLSKHFVALKDYVNNPDNVPMEQWEEKIGDIICYLHLLEAIIKTKKG